MMITEQRAKALVNELAEGELSWVLWVYERCQKCGAFVDRIGYEEHGDRTWTATWKCRDCNHVQVYDMEY